MGKLIRLELFNFKSYKGHHILLFGDSYFTSIVGPNGSGKSNSMDAISFVLGIKSSHLRSTHLRDLVYRGRVLRTSTINADGTATEKPDGATNGDAPTQENGDRGPDASQQLSQGPRHDPQTAWVMAVYVDEMGEEQRWKRSITSAGQSEYRINNRIVSAKQYNEDLEKENILIRARNFLVFQGDVEAIASQSPRDLTRLVEQISGSLECKDDYDRLKLEAEKTAEDQAFRLNQRRAINSEIKQYQEQKREAENYARKADERDGAVVTHVLWKLFHFQRVMEESGAEIQKHQAELQDYRRGVEKYERRLEEARKEQAKATRDVTRVERDIKAAEKDVEEKENSLVPIDEKIAISRRNLDKYGARVAEVSSERDKQARNVDQLTKDLNKVQKAQTKWEEEWRASAQQEGRELSEADLQEYNRLRGEVNKQTSAHQSRVDNITRQVKTDEETVQNLRSKVEGAQDQARKREEEIQQLTERRDGIDSERKRTNKEIDAKRTELNMLTSDRERTTQKQTDLDEKLQQVLRKLIDADDGRRQSEKEVRARETVSAMRRIFPGVRGRLHELCKPKQRRFETAVATVLGRHVDAIVVDTERTAKDCIQYLRDQRAGQATFIPLDTIQVKAVNANMKGMHRGMRLAIDTIDYEGAVERAVSYACGNSMVCDDLAVARHLCYERNIEAKAVTLDGTVIHKGGLMTGGRGPQDRRNARRWEDSELENLRRLKEKLEADLAALPKGHRRGTEEETLQGALAGLEQRLNYLREEIRALDRTIASKRVEADHARAQLRETQPTYDQRRQRLDGLSAELEESRAAVAAAEDRVFAAFCTRLGYASIRDYEARQGSRQRDAAARKLEFATQRGTLEHQLTFETQRLAATKERLAALDAAAARDRTLADDLEAEKADIETAAATRAAELEELGEKLEGVKETQEQRAAAVAEQRKEVQKRGKAVEGVMKQIDERSAEVRKNAAGRYALLRKCRIDEVKIPLAEGSEGLAALPLDQMVGGGAADEDAMDVDGEDEEDQGGLAGMGGEINDYGIEVDYEELDEELREDESPTRETTLLDAITALTSQLDKMAPNMRAIERLSGVESRLATTERDYNDARTNHRRAKDAFEDTRAMRAELFGKALTHIADQIGTVYKELTRSAAFPPGGQAYLDAEDGEEPYLAGLKYHAMPPLKRFRDMEHLSGGEKTMAALALLFAVHSYQPSPFFVLDEVDAALDNANVAKVAQYVREHAGPGMQFIVISLKAGFFQESETLVGIMRDQGKNSSRALTLDLRKYPTAV